MEKTLTKFRSFEEAERADRDFYKRLIPQERLAILLELLNHALSNDSKEFIALLNSHGVEYLIVGAHRRDPTSISPTSISLKEDGIWKP